MPRRVLFTADYDHRWPSRAVTAFKAGMDLLVKDEVAEAALAKGKVEMLSSQDDAPAQVADRGSDLGLAERDDADDVGAELRVPGDVPARKRSRARKRDQ